MARAEQRREEERHDRAATLLLPRRPSSPRAWQKPGYRRDSLRGGILPRHPDPLRPPGILLGILGLARGERRLGTIAIVVSVLGLVVGFILSFLVLYVAGV
jgi:hypothetical protein